MRRLTLGLGLGCGLFAACFTAPAADVMFSCDPASAPACPEGYSCETDGCCHRDGSDVAAHAGECKLQGGTEGGTTMLPATSTGGTGSTGTGESGTETTSETGASSSSDDGSSGTSATESSSADATDTSATAGSSGGSTT